MRAVLLSVFLALVGILATNTVRMPEEGRPWVWVALLLLVAAGVFIEVRRHRSGVVAQRRRSTSNQVAGTVHGTVIQAGMIGGSVTVINRSRPVLSDALAEAADQLAVAVRTQWSCEEEQLRVHDPFPLPVRWHGMSEILLDHPANVCRAPAGTTPAPLDLTGHLDQVVEIYQRIPSGRLVISGPAGSGKTILALRVVLDLLDTRTAADPVPVIFSLGSWNPATTSLRDWLTRQLVRDYPGLAEPGPARGGSAAALVNAGRILPVLDGFDEIADELHRPALEALSATCMPLLLTSRSAEYAAAVTAGDVLTSAAGIELDDLTLADLADYLPRTAHRIIAGNGDTATVWDPVLAHLRDHPDSPGAINITAALATPLMVAMVRASYSDTPGRDPADLLDTDRFCTPRAIEDHLLEAYVPSVCQRPPLDRYSTHRRRRHWDPDRVQHWLGHLAWHLDQLGTPDLAWWQLGNTIPRSVRALTVLLVFGLASALLVEVVPGSGPGLLLGFVSVLRLILGQVEDVPSCLRVKVRGQARRTLKKIIIGFASWLGRGFVVGFAISFLLGLVDNFSVGTVGRFMDELKFVDDLAFGLGGKVGVMFGIEPEVGQAIGLALQNGLLGGLMFGLAFGLWGAVVRGFSTPIDIRAAADPLTLLAINRKNTITQSIGFGVVGALVSVLVFGLDAMLAHLLTVGLLGGLLVMLVSGLDGNAWGQWLILSRVWLPLTGRLPWAVAAFLDDACQRGVLRQAGAVYQFRHARLQRRLADARASNSRGAQG